MFYPRHGITITTIIQYLLLGLFYPSPSHGLEADDVLGVWVRQAGPGSGIGGSKADRRCRTQGGQSRVGQGRAEKDRGRAGAVGWRIERSAASPSQSPSSTVRREHRASCNILSSCHLVIVSSCLRVFGSVSSPPRPLRSPPSRPSSPDVRVSPPTPKRWSVRGNMMRGCECSHRSHWHSRLHPIIRCIPSSYRPPSLSFLILMPVSLIHLRRGMYPGKT